MEIDYAFVAKMLSKQYKHLVGVEKNLDYYIEDCQRQIASLEKINDHQKYGNLLKELRFKLAEALEKMSHVKPNLDKINEQIPLLEAKA